MKNVGLIGVGVMGRLMVPRILGAGHRLAMYDVSKAALEDVASRDIIVGASPAHVAVASELILMSLPGPEQVEQGVNGPDGLLTKARLGIAIVDLSTVGPETTVLMADAASKGELGTLMLPFW